MELNRPSGLIASVFAAIFLTIVLGSTASAAIREKAYAFNGTDGTGYRAGLRLDATGNLWGTSPFGGVYGYGNVFELTRDTKGHLTETVLYSFTNGNDGGYPVDDDGPTADSAGNLYGTTAGGGAYGGGAVFKLMPSRNGWQESVLYSLPAEVTGAFPRPASCSILPGIFTAPHGAGALADRAMVQSLNCHPIQSATGRKQPSMYSPEEVMGQALPLV